MKNNFENAVKLIRECVEFNILESYDRKVKVFFEPDDKEKEAHWTWMTVEDAAKDVVKQNAFSILEEALEKAKEVWVDGVTFKTDSEVYVNMMSQAKDYCIEHFPELYETVFGESDDFFLYNDGYSQYTLYYYNPNSVAEGTIVECYFDDEGAKRILGGEPLMNILAENNQYHHDIDTIHFFNTLRALADSQYTGEFVGNAKNEEELKVLIQKVLKNKWKYAEGEKEKAKRIIEDCIDNEILYEEDNVVNSNLTVHYLKEMPKMKKEDFAKFISAQEEYETDVEYNVMSQEYLEKMLEAKRCCSTFFPELHESVFGNKDYNFVFSCGSDYHFLYYYNSDSNEGGQIVECPFDDDMARRMINGEDMMDVLAEQTQYLSDVNTDHFFHNVYDLVKSRVNEDYIGARGRKNYIGCDAEENLIDVLKQCIKKN